MVSVCSWVCACANPHTHTDRRTHSRTRTQSHMATAPASLKGVVSPASPAEMMKTKITCPAPGVSDSADAGLGPGAVSLTSPQVTLLPLIRGPSWERCSREPALRRTLQGENSCRRRAVPALCSRDVQPGSHFWSDCWPPVRGISHPRLSLGAGVPRPLALRASPALRTTVWEAATVSPQLMGTEDAAYVFRQTTPNPHSSLATVILALACAAVSQKS